MKRALQILVLCFILVLAGFFALRTYTKSHSPGETVTSGSEMPQVRVDYCRPYMKNRKVFGELVPFNNVWRTGANEATVITLASHVRVNGQPLPAGSYSLWTIPGEQRWAVIFNSETGQWGTNYNQSRDVLRVELPVEQLADTIEQFTISLPKTNDGYELLMMWENTRVRIPITLN